MKFSEKWLREFVDPNIDTDTLAQQLTLAGLEVDGITPVCLDLQQCVIAEVKSFEADPNEPGFLICKVDYGIGDVVTVKSNAPNVRVGLYTVLVKNSAIPNSMSVDSINQELTQGKLCSASDIGIGETNNTLIELSSSECLGTPLSEIIAAEDNIIELSLTPNRGDCLSIQGIAREVAVINRLKLQKLEVESIPVTSKGSRQIKVSVEESCPRYAGRIIENINASVKSPLWLTERLRCSDIRSINIIVDIINFVMLELGQPMHGFDNDCLHGEINVRYAKDGERVKLLNECEYEIRQHTLLITDDSEVLAMAGIMGSYDSAVTTKTRNIFIESAYFTPEVILGKARQYGLHTDSSHRFERGVDPELQQLALERASSLILELCGGQAGAIVEVVSDLNIKKSQNVILRKSQIKRILGIDIPGQFVIDTLMSLGMSVNHDGDKFIIVPPTYRFDIQIEADLIEELMRIYGYENILETTIPAYPLKLGRQNKVMKTIQKIHDILINRDYQEAITYSFVSPKLNKLFSNEDKYLALANPITTELSTMRVSLWPGLLQALQYNIQHQRDRVRLFEFGKVFKVKNNEVFEQNDNIAGIIYGNLYSKQWNKNDILCNFYDIKGDVEAILYQYAKQKNMEFNSCNMASLHPGQAVEINIDGKVVGHLGQLHPDISTAFDLVHNVYLFEIEVKNIIQDHVIRYQKISRFPSIKRDISIILDEKISYSEVADCIKSNATELLCNLELFDVYQGKGIEKSKKSLSINLTFQSISSTLVAEEIDTIIENIISHLHNSFSAELRG